MYVPYYTKCTLDILFGPLDSLSTIPCSLGSSCFWVESNRGHLQKSRERDSEMEASMPLVSSQPVLGSVALAFLYCSLQISLGSPLLVMATAPLLVPVISPTSSSSRPICGNSEVLCHTLLTSLTTDLSCPLIINRSALIILPVRGCPRFPTRALADPKGKSVQVFSIHEFLGLTGKKWHIGNASPVHLDHKLPRPKESNLEVVW